MSYMKIEVRDKQVNIPVQDAVRVDHASITKMANDLVARIDRDRADLLEDFNGDPDVIRQYFSTTGDVMIVGVVSLSYTNKYRLHTELYVCKIERHAHIEV